MSSFGAAPLVGVVVPWRDAPEPLVALSAVAGGRHPFLRLFAGGPPDLGAWSTLATDPDRTWSVPAARVGAGFFPALARRWPRRVTRHGPRIPFAGGWAVTLGYELRSAVERTPPPRPPPMGFPAAWLGHYDACAAWDHGAGKAYLAGIGRTRAKALAAARALEVRVARGLASRPPASGARRPAPAPVPAIPAAAYRRRVEEVRARILRGDLFQANLSQRFDGRLAGTPLDLFRRLAAASKAPFLAYLDVGNGRHVLSASPERFLARRGDRVETRPMKGTRPRGRTPMRDRRLAAALARSEKERAELAMIVDLSRNDLARVCRPGTVRVATPRRLERHAVHQAVGVVVGRLRADADGADLVRACFPPGSVTGAPKVEAMRVIDDLEREGRGPYCGAIGWLDEGGDLDLAVAIRTLCVAGSRVSYRVGGGVTLLSDPASEHAETLAKGRSLAAAVTRRGAGNGR